VGPGGGRKRGREGAGQIDAGHSQGDYLEKRRGSQWLLGYLRRYSIGEKGTSLPEKTHAGAQVYWMRNKILHVKKIHQVDNSSRVRGAPFVGGGGGRYERGTYVGHREDLLTERFCTPSRFILKEVCFKSEAL